MASVGTVISFPTPLYSNLPIESGFFQPSQFVISAITEGATTTITTTVDQNYVVGQQIRLTIPPAYGAYQLNGIQGMVISIPSSTQVTINVDSSFFDAFIPSPVFVTGQNLSVPQILAIGDFNGGQINSSGRNNLGTFIPGSFENISPL